MQGNERDANGKNRSPCSADPDNHHLFWSQPQFWSEWELRFPQMVSNCARTSSIDTTTEGGHPWISVHFLRL